MLADFVPIGLGGLLLIVSLGTAVPYPSLVLGGLALAVVAEVSLAHCPGLRPVGHAFPSVMAACDPVHILHHTAVDLQGAYSASLIADGKIVARGLYDDQGRDEVGESGHGLKSCARWLVAPLGVVFAPPGAKLFLVGSDGLNQLSVDDRHTVLGEHCEDGEVLLGLLGFELLDLVDLVAVGHGLNWVLRMAAGGNFTAIDIHETVAGRGEPHWVTRQRAAFQHPSSDPGHVAERIMRSDGSVKPVPGHSLGIEGTNQSCQVER